jgi:hypothetical protein
MGVVQPRLVRSPESRKTAQPKPPTSTAPPPASRQRPELLASTVNIEIGGGKTTRDLAREKSVKGGLLMRSIEIGELASGAGIGVIGADSVLEWLYCRKSSSASLVAFALGIKGAG